MWLSVAAVQSARASIFRNFDPALVGRAGAADLRGAINALDNRLIIEQRPPNPAEMRLVRRHLASLPLSPEAVRLVALDAQARGDRRQYERALRLSQQLSRRDVHTQILLVQSSVLANDASGAIRHLDLALRVRPKVSPAIYEALSKSLADPRIERAMLPIVVEGRPWLAGFLVSALQSGVDPVIVARLLQSGDAFKREGVADAVAPLLLSRLLTVGQVTLAKRVGSPLAKEPEALGASLAADANGRDRRLGLWAWTPADAADTAMDFVVDGEQHVIRGFVRAGTGRSVATRALTLAPGAYSLRAEAETLAGGGGAVVLDLSCGLEGASPFWTSSDLTDALRMSFDVPSGCPVQHASLRGVPASGDQDLEFSVSALELAPSPR